MSEVPEQSPGMMAGDARVPERVRRAQEQAQRLAAAEALAAALRRNPDPDTTRHNKAAPGPSESEVQP